MNDLLLGGRRAMEVQRKSKRLGNPIKAFAPYKGTVHTELGSYNVQYSNLTSQVSTS